MTTPLVNVRLKPLHTARSWAQRGIYIVSRILSLLSADPNIIHSPRGQHPHQIPDGIMEKEWRIRVWIKRSVQSTKAVTLTSLKGEGGVERKFTA